MHDCNTFVTAVAVLHYSKYWEIGQKINMC